MKNELNPVIVFGAIGLVAIVVIVAGYMVLGPKKFNPDTKGSEQDIQRVIQKGEPMYKPPADVPGIVTPGGAGPGSRPPGAPGAGMVPGAPTGR